MIGDIFICFVVFVFVYAIYSAPKLPSAKDIDREITDKLPTQMGWSEAQIKQFHCERRKFQERLYPTEMTKTDMIRKLSNDVAAVRSLLEKKEETP